MTDEEKKAIELLRAIDTIDLRETEQDLEGDFNKAIDIVLNLLSKKDKVIEEIQTFCRNQLAFQNRLVRSEEKITEFNNGRFDVCEEILYIIDTEEENE